MNKKKCTKCGEEKILDDFSRNKNHKDGHDNQCKICHKKSITEYYRTRKGLFSLIYSEQVTSSRKRKHPEPAYSRDDLFLYATSQSVFECLYREWVDSCYLTEKRPSIDRLSDNLPYTINNIQLITWGENREKSYRDRRNGRIDNICKSVIGINQKTGDKIEFHSINEAFRQTGIHISTISKCCTRTPIVLKNGKLFISKSAGGYKWNFKEKQYEKSNINIV